MYDIVDGNRTGQTVMVRWDVFGYASPVSTTYPRDSRPDPGLGPSMPAWVLAAVGALYAALTGCFSYQEYRRRRPRGAGRTDSLRK